MDDRTEGNGSGETGGIVNPYEAVGCESEETGTEGGQSSVFLGLEVDGGEKETLNLAWEEYRPAGGGEFYRREPRTNGHGRGESGVNFATAS